MGIVVGIHNTGIMSSAAIVADGQLVFAAMEERFSRNKADKYFPHQAIEAALNFIDASFEDVDIFALGWNPGLNIGFRTRAGFSEWPAYPGERLYAAANQLLPILQPDDMVETEQIFRRKSAKDVRIVHVPHHMAHCANGFYLSPFDEAAILSCDGYGERASMVWATGNAEGIEVLKETHFPNSLGLFYSAVTQHLGFRPDHDEWKVMGAAAYGDAAVYKARMARLFSVSDAGDLSLVLEWFDHFNFDSPGLFNGQIESLFGPPRKRHEPLERRHFDIAAAAQNVVEEYLDTAFRWLKSETGLRQACFVGGVAQNVVCNGKLSQSNIFEDIFIPFAPDDSGNAIGAALWVAQENSEPIIRGASPFLGMEFDDEQIESTLTQFGVVLDRPKNMIEEVSTFLANGAVVGWFQGRMEFGQRALGGRSILADPRRLDMKDHVNAAIKFREKFRPFAPAVLKEKAGDFFHLPDGCSSTYMERAFQAREDKVAQIPAVVHEDGSARVQTVDRSLSPLFYELIEAFGCLTGVPVLLNTSFNLNGEPIVATPEDAVRTFYSSGLDILVIGSYVVKKDSSWNG